MGYLTELAVNVSANPNFDLLEFTLLIDCFVKLDCLSKANWKSLHLLSNVSADPNFDELKFTMEKKISSELPVGKSALLPQQKMYSTKERNYF